MRRGANIPMRLALALPLAYAAYIFLYAWHWGPVRPLSILEAWLPAVFALIGCWLILSGRPGRFVWLGVMAAGVWLVFIVLWLDGWGVEYMGGWTVNARALLGDADEVVAGLYAILFSLAHLLAAPRQTPGVRPSPN